MNSAKRTNPFGVSLQRFRQQSERSNARMDAYDRGDISDEEADRLLAQEVRDLLRDGDPE